MKAIGYIRASTDDQTLTIEAQQERVEAYCKLYGMELVEIVTEHASGKSIGKRKKFLGVLEALEAGTAEALVVVKMDRLTRRVLDLCELMDRFNRHSWRLCSVMEQIDTVTPQGRMLLHLLGTFAEYEREVISARTKEVIRYLRDHDRAFNHAPYGMVKTEEKTLIPHEDERHWARKARELRSRGKSLRAIGAFLRSQGAVGKNGGAWHPPSVKALLAAAD